MPNDQDSGDSQQLLKAIQTMLSGAGQIAGAGGGPSSPGTPGTVAPGPTPNISFNPLQGGGGPIQTAPPRPVGPAPQTGSQSIRNSGDRTATTNAGLVSLGNSLSSMFSSVGQKEHEKKAAMAEGYLMQINSLLASGDPKDKEKAMMFLEDPKIKKILKTGLEYVPLEEEVPPEAVGVQKAVQKIGQQQQQQPPKQMQPVIPQPSVQQKLQSAMQSALLQKIQADPASAISMMGGSQLTSAEQRASEFYEKGLGMSPAQMAGMTAAEKLAGIKMYEGVMRDALKAEVDMYKADKSYSGKIDTAKIFAAAKDRMTQAVKEVGMARVGASRDNAKLKKGGAAQNFAVGAKMYEDMAKKYLDLSKQANIKPEDKKRYEGMAEQYNQKADDFLNQAGDEDLWNMFKGAMEGETEEEPN
jgi:hypothetical protein